MLEDEGFVVVGRITLRPSDRFLVHFDRREAQSWGPAIYAFRVGGEVVRIGKTESTLKNRMNEWERLVSRALAGHFQKGGTNPFEAFEWRHALAARQKLRRKDSRAVWAATGPGASSGRFD
jgi:hypothetical protein